MAKVLVSLFVLSLGAMTALAMQTAALLTAQQSEYRTTAVRLASELAATMRLHSARMSADGFRSSFLKIDSSSNMKRDESLLKKTCYAGDDECSSEEFLQFEIEAIKSQVRNSLPEGRLRVCHDAFPEGKDIRHQWACAGNEQMPVVIKLGWNGKRDDVHSTQGREEIAPKLVLTVASYLN